MAGDERLSGRSEGHEPEAVFEQFYLEHFAGLVRLAYLVTLEEQEARDVVQECFIGAARRWDDIDEPLAYLRRSVANRSYRSIRDARRRRDKTERHAALAAVEVRDDVDELTDVIAGLPARQRAVVVLRFYLELSTDEIAAALDMPRGSVGPTLGRALQRLRVVVPR